MTPPAPDYCEFIPRLAGAPTIDGVLESALAYRDLVPVGWTSHDDAPIPSGFAVRYAIGWWPGGLLFIVDVSDAARHPADPAEPPYCGDAPEVYVDADGKFPEAPGYDEPGARQFIARTPSGETPSRSGSAYKEAGPYPWTSGFVVLARPGGYVLEAQITAASLGLSAWPLAEGIEVGINVSVNVSTADGTLRPTKACPLSRRLGQLYLRVAETPIGDCVEPWCNVKAHCTPRLVGN